MPHLPPSPTSPAILLAALLAACSQEAEAPVRTDASAATPPVQPSTDGAEPAPPPPGEGPSILQEVFTIAEAGRSGPDAAGAYQAARERLQEALEDYPGDPKLHAAMGHLWVDEVMWRRLQGEERERHRAQAEACYRRALELDPHHVRANAGLGDLLLNLESTAGAEAALPYYERALAADPHDGHARQRMAEALTKLDRADEAAALLAEAPAPLPAPKEEPDLELIEEPPELIEEPPEAEPPELIEEPPEAEPPEPAPTGAMDAQLEAWKKLAEREAGNAAVQRAVAIQCRQRGDEACAREYEARADALEAAEGSP